MKRILSRLNIEKIGLLEIMLALYPIISGYQYGFIPMSLVWLLVMDAVAMTKKRQRLQEKLLMVVFLFVLLHEIVVWVITGFPSTHLNFILSTSICLFSIFIIAPVLQYDRLEGSLFLVGYISCIGLLYHFGLLLSGESISPIRLPFLPAPDMDSRLYEVSDRPCSFYWEPASFVTFMMIPLFISMIKKRWVILVFILLCIFLSTSTNGIILAPCMILVYVLMARQKTFSRVFVAVMLFGMVFLLFNSNFFEMGIDKLTNTNVESNVRTSNGPWLISHMPAEHIFFGLPTHTVEEYVDMGFVSNERVRSHGGMFLSDFWLVWASYGIIGLVLYIISYIQFAYRERTLWPYIAVLLIALFSQSLSFRPLYVYQLCFILCYLRNQQLFRLEK